jgi:hypothetical protein
MKHVDLNTPVDVTGISLTSNLGSISITGDANLTLTGQATYFSNRYC